MVKSYPTIFVIVTSVLELYLLYKQGEALADVEAVGKLLDLEERYEGTTTEHSKAEIEQKSAELSAYQGERGEEMYEEYLQLKEYLNVAILFPIC